MAGRISIRDLAKIAGVSRTTVSLALRDSHKISEPMRQRIQTLALKHNYRSHPLLASLMQQIRVKKKIQDEEILGFITSGITADEWKNWSWNQEIWKGAEAEAHTLGFRLESFWAGYRAQNARHLSNVLYHRGIRGLFFAPMPWPHSTFYMPWQKFAVIACTPSTGIKELPVVKSNHQNGIYTLLLKLRELGAKSIGIALPEEEDLRVERGWSAGLHIFKLLDGIPKIHLLRMKQSDNFSEFSTWFKKTRPEVVVGFRSEVADFLTRLSLTPGVNIAYASLNVETKSLGRIAGFYQDPAYLGRRAVQYISRAIYNQSLGIPTHPESIAVEGCFVDGDSLRPLTRK